MGVVPISLATRLRDELGLVRAVETGTHTGTGALRLSRVFPEVVTIELSEQLHRYALSQFAGTERITALRGHSAALLSSLSDGPPTLYWLDAHWSTGSTAGADEQCPVLAELEALKEGIDSDCFIIDDARLFLAAPPPPQDPAQWPSIFEVFDAIRRVHPGYHITVAHDLVIAVPRRARGIVDDFAWHSLGHHWPLPRRAMRHVLARALARLDRRGDT